MISGPPESLKTVIATIIAITARRQRWAVAHVDLEMGAHADVARRARRGRRRDPRLRLHRAGRAAFPEDIGSLISNGIGLVVIDAAAGAYSVSGLDDNARKDVERFAQAWIEPLYRAGVATILIDHVTKNAENRGKWAIGSERKAGQADVHLGLELVGSPLSRGGNALVKVHVHKDRPDG